MRQFNGDDRPRRIPQELARARIAAQAAHGPKYATRQHGRRTQHAARAGRDDRAGPGTGCRGEQCEIRRTRGCLVGQEDEGCAGRARQRVDAGHERTRKPMAPLPVHHDPRGNPG
jgi:hypothetical protein